MDVRRTWLRSPYLLLRYRHSAPSQFSDKTVWNAEQQQRGMKPLLTVCESLHPDHMTTSAGLVLL